MAWAARHISGFAWAMNGWCLRCGVRVSGCALMGGWSGDPFYENTGGPRPWISDAEESQSAVLVGAEIVAMTIAPRPAHMEFSNGMTLDVGDRPGTARPTDRCGLIEGDDLRRAVFLSPTYEIWV